MSRPPAVSGTGERTRRGVRLAQAGLLVNAVLVVVKVVTGVIGQSYALIADGVESSLDIFSSLIVWRGINVAARSADDSYHFGYVKAESVAAAAVALLLIGVAAGIAIEAIRAVRSPPHVAPASFTLIVLVIVIILKETMFRYVLREGEALGSGVVQADAWHHRSDAITSAAAFLGISIALAGGDAWAAADDYAALFASAIIAFNGMRILRPALADLMDRAPEPALLERVAHEAGREPGVRCIEKILARRAGAGHFLTLHVQADPDMTLHDAHELGHRVRTRLVEQIPSVLDALIHMEPFEGLPADEPADQRMPGLQTPRRVSGHRPRTSD